MHGVCARCCIRRECKLLPGLPRGEVFGLHCIKSLRNVPSIEVCILWGIELLQLSWKYRQPHGIRVVHSMRRWFHSR